MSFTITVVDNITTLGITETPVVISEQIAGIAGAKGDTGGAGPANTLSIGTVSSGSTASATITGTSPTQTLNLVMKTGDTGPTGQGFTAMGVYSAGTAYAAYDTVYYNGQQYRCKLASTGNSPLNTTYWELFAQGLGTPAAYSAIETYSPGNLVTRSGSTYYCIATVTGAAPPNATYWLLLASKGDTGDTGTQGPTGPAGPTTATVGNAVLMSTVTKATNNTTPEAVFRTSGGTISYFAVDADTTYLFEGMLQLQTKNSATAAAAVLSLIYVATGSTSTLTEQASRLIFNTNQTTSTYIGVGGMTDATNTNCTGSITSSSSITYHIKFRGFIRTNASTAGRINIGATQSVAGSSAAPDFVLGSYMNVYKLGSGASALSGTWT
jgi:hypothetical protein